MEQTKLFYPFNKNNFDTFMESVLLLHHKVKNEQL